MNYDNLSFSPKKDMEVQEITDLKNSNKQMRERIKELRSAIETYEQEIAGDNLILKNLKEDVNYYQLKAGHRGAEGPGITITLEGFGGENIANAVENKKYLLILINELRFFNAEILAINNYRITGRSEVTLAGSHINVNGSPIAPPYRIQAIGDPRAFQRYVEHGTLIFEYMSSDGIRSNIQFEDNIVIPAIQRERTIEFVKPIEGTDET
ncbi:DUF881 domain-containing protein [Alkaliphilus hydrothermalis]|nr:DUF881 domain-containing protein [Alkaliphilus hydrothermalis]